MSEARPRRAGQHDRDDCATADGEWPRGSAGGPPPPRREQLPLPRRDGQAHLEPQLREPGGTGSGTPFDAFTGADRADGAPAASSSGARAAAFRTATGRAPTGDVPRHAAPDEPDAFALPATDPDQADGEPDASR